MKHFKLALIASVLTISGSALAATDGVFTTTGSTTGSSVVSITKQDGVALIGVADMAFAAAASINATTAAKNDDVCVFSSTGGYSVTATSQNDPAGPLFNLESATAATTIGYTMTWTDNTGATLPLVNGTALPGQSGNSTDSTCPTDNANFGVTLSVADFTAADPASYQDTVNLLITSL